MDNYIDIRYYLPSFAAGADGETARNHALCAFFHRSYDIDFMGAEDGEPPIIY